MTQDKMTKDTPAPNEMPDEIYAKRYGQSSGGTYWDKLREGETRTRYIRADLTATVAAGGENKPAVYYCENGKTLEGLEQGALAVLSNLMIKTNAQTAEFMIGNEKDGEFYFTCSRGKQPAAPAVDLEKLKRHYVDAYEFWDRASVDFIEHMIDDLAAQGMIKGRG